MPRRPEPPQRLLTTILFTDIVGSTERAAELGDREWRRVISAHHALARRNLKRFGGKEVDNAGDGFFATFDQPGQAIRCAEAMVEGVRSLGIEIRAGIHMGEVEVIGPKVGGIAVHIAARIMSKGGPGEVLVSNTIRDLMSGSELTFQDLGAQELKGVPAQWHLYAVEPAAGRPPADERAPPPEELTDGEPRRRTRALAAGGVILLLVAAVATLFVLRQGSSALTVGPNTVVRIDADKGKVAGVAAVGTTPIGVAAGDGMVWVANFDGRTVQAIDVESGQAGQAFGGISGNPSAVAVGGGYVWVAIFQGGVQRIDPRENNAVTTIDVGIGGSGIAFGDGYTWVTNSQEDTLTRIDPSTLDLKVFPLDPGGQPRGVAVGAGSVWVAESLKGVVARVDQRSGDIQTIPMLRGNPTEVAFGGGFAWVTNSTDDSVFRIDPGSNGGTVIPNVGNGPQGITAGPEGVWVANALDGTVAEIRGTAVVRRVHLGGFSVEGVAATAGGIWATVHARS